MKRLETNKIMSLEIPALAEVKKVSPTEVLFRWGNGHEQLYSAAHLRKSCRCAYCVNELTGERMLDEKGVPGDLKVEAISLVGRYAINFKFSDFHESGIYPFELLYRICPCKGH